MNYWLQSGAALLMAAAVAACESPVDPSRISPEGLSEEQARFVQLVMEHRNGVGCKVPLVWSDKAAEVARRHAEDMALQGYFSHTSKDGRKLGDRLKEGGVYFSYAGENIAAGHATVEKAFQGWLNSPPHRENLERCGWRYHALGVHGSHRVHLFVIP